MTNLDRWIDATLPLGPETPLFPGDPPIEIVQEMTLEQGDPVNLRRYRLSGHYATHVDAPRHLLADGADVASLDPARFAGSAWVAEVTTETAISAEDLRKQMPDGEQFHGVFLKTAASRAWRKGNFRNFPVPYLEPKAAQFLVDRSVRLVGTDSLSVDPPESHDLPSHRILLGAGVPIIEGLDLSGVPPGFVHFVALPVRWVGADGAPVRIFIRPA